MTIKQKRFENYNKVKETIRQDTWCSNHINCFRASFSSKGRGNKPESPEHIKTKFERWMYWRGKNFDIITEGRLIIKDKTEDRHLRPDLIVWNENEIFIEEIVCSEKEESLIKKKKIYPFPVFAFNLKTNGGKK